MYDADPENQPLLQLPKYIFSSHQNMVKMEAKSQAQSRK
jgi:hypothetical protein